MQPVRHALAAAAFALLAAPSFALDLMDAYTQATAHDASHAAAAQALAAGREKAVQGRSLLLPQLQLAASGTHRQGQDTSGSVHEAALQLRQPLLALPTHAERGQLEQQTALAELRWRDAGQQLMQRVAEAYLQVLLAEEHLQVLQAEHAAVALQRDRAQARFDLGRGRITDLQEAQARLDAVATRELQGQSTLAQRRAQFETLTGAPAVGLAPLRADLPPQAPSPASAAEWQDRAASGALRVLSKDRELAIAALETRKTSLAARPTLDLVASAGTQGQSGALPPALAGDGRRSSSIGLQLNIPLYTGGGWSSKQRESLALHRQVEHELAAARRDARLQAHDAYLAVQTGVSRIGSLQQALRSAATALEATTLGRDLGTRTELDVLDAQQRLFSTRLDLAQARSDHLLGHIRLAAAAGVLDTGALQAINTQLVR